jgi:starch synthase
VGGLADTVEEGENGFVFEGDGGDAMEAALERGLRLYAQGEAAWRGVRLRAMSGKFGWEQRAADYIEVYQPR